MKFYFALLPFFFLFLSSGIFMTIYSTYYVGQENVIITDIGNIQPNYMTLTDCNFDLLYITYFTENCGNMTSIFCDEFFNLQKTQNYYKNNKNTIAYYTYEKGPCSGLLINSINCPTFDIALLICGVMSIVISILLGISIIIFICDYFDNKKNNKNPV